MARIIQAERSDIKEPQPSPQLATSGLITLPAVGKSNGVRSLDIAGTIGSLLSVEVGLGVVISHSIGVSVGGDLIRVGLSLVGGGSVIGNRSWPIGRGDHSSRGSSSQTGGDDEDLTGTGEILGY